MVGLCIDTSGPSLTLALWHQGHLLAAQTEAAEKRHSDMITEVLGTLLNKTGLKTNDIEVIAVVNGPGSFSGLRVGLAFAKGMSLGLGCRLLALNALEALAFSAGAGAGLLSPVIDAKKSQIYAALYELSPDDFRTLKEPMAVAPADWMQSLPEGARLLGSGVDICRALLSPRNPSQYVLEGLQAPTPVGLLRLAERKYRAGPFTSPEELEALYLRPADAVLKAKVR